MPDGGPGSLKGMCRNCGSFGARPLGHCSVCEGAVCDRCGNVQVIGGDHKPIHDHCVKHDDAGFTMIKFVK